MIWAFLCFIGRHDWQPVFQHRVERQGTLTSLVRCYRRRLDGTLCLAENYIRTVSDERGAQVK